MKIDIETSWGPTRPKCQGFICSRSTLLPLHSKSRVAWKKPPGLSVGLGKVEYPFFSRAGPGSGAKLVQSHPYNYQEAKLLFCPWWTLNGVGGDMFILLYSDNSPCGNDSRNQSLLTRTRVKSVWFCEVPFYKYKHWDSLKYFHQAYVCHQ